MNSISIEELEELKTTIEILALYAEATALQSHPLILHRCSVEGCKSYWLSDNRDIDAYLNCEDMVTCDWESKCMRIEYVCDKHADVFFKTFRHKTYNITAVVCPECFNDFQKNADTESSGWYYDGK